MFWLIRRKHESTFFFFFGNTCGKIFIVSKNLSLSHDHNKRTNHYMITLNVPIARVSRELIPFPAELHFLVKHEMQLLLVCRLARLNKKNNNKKKPSRTNITQPMLNFQNFEKQTAANAEQKGKTERLQRCCAAQVSAL